MNIFALSVEPVHEAPFISFSPSFTFPVILPWSGKA
jgi:hypothetical protein